jgi:hypothetical protein
MQLLDIFQNQSRTLYEWPQIDLVDEPEINQFRAIVWRTVAASVVSTEVTPEVGRLLQVLVGEMSRAELMASLGLKDEKHFRESYQQAAVTTGLVEMTIPDKPQSRNQKYRLTAAGRAYTEQKNQGDD